jgi:crossover junction endodeoxyribonuclease RuvC
VDPGTLRAGWAVLDEQPQRAHRVASGVWRLGSSQRTLPERLFALARQLEVVLDEHAPGAVALEAAFFGRNARSALRIGEARGVVMMAAAARGLPVLEIPPATVKRRVTGAGGASKQQIERLVRMHLDRPDLRFAAADESDAIAVALCALLERRTGAAVPAAVPAARRRAALPAGARLQ